MFYSDSRLEYAACYTELNLYALGSVIGYVYVIGLGTRICNTPLNASTKQNEDFGVAYLKSGLKSEMFWLFLLENCNQWAKIPQH